MLVTVVFYLSYYRDVLLPSERSYASCRSGKSQVAVSSHLFSAGLVYANSWNAMVPLPRRRSTAAREAKAAGRRQLDALRNSMGHCHEGYDGDDGL